MIRLRIVGCVEVNAAIFVQVDGGDPEPAACASRDARARADIAECPIPEVRQQDIGDAPVVDRRRVLRLAAAVARLVARRILDVVDGEEVEVSIPIDVDPSRGSAPSTRLGGAAYTGALADVLEGCVAAIA